MLVHRPGHGDPTARRSFPPRARSSASTSRPRRRSTAGRSRRAATSRTDADTDVALLDEHFAASTSPPDVGRRPGRPHRRSLRRARALARVPRTSHDVGRGDPGAGDAGRAVRADRARRADRRRPPAQVNDAVVRVLPGTDVERVSAELMSDALAQSLPGRRAHGHGATRRTSVSSALQRIGERAASLRRVRCA